MNIGFTGRQIINLLGAPTSVGPALTVHLSLMIILYCDQYCSFADALDDGRKAVKWATDYLLKAHVSENELYAQVGLGLLDYLTWGRPEDMTMGRPAYKIDKSHPGNIFA
jgi:hypothetical protein